MISKIQKRYAQESAESCNLSCGTNIDNLNIQRGEAVLDMGCGRGTETIKAALAAGPEGEAVGLDITPAMIEVARSNAEELRVSNVRFMAGDIESLPFKDGSFDAVISNCVINHARDKETVYREIMRVLKEGGRFVVSDAVTRTALPDEIKNDPEAWAQCFGGAVTENEYLESICKAGFDKIAILKRREYLKNGFDFISLTIQATKYI